MKKVKNILGALILISAPFTTKANTPCTAQTDLCPAATVSSTCTWTAAGNGIVDPTCTTAGGAFTGEHWIEYTPSAGATDISLTLTDALGGGTNPVDDVAFQIYTSANGCAGPFTYINCFNNNSGGGTDESETFVLTPGVTYFIRVYDADRQMDCAGGGRNQDFEYCITENGTNPNELCIMSTTLVENTACQEFSTLFADNTGDVLPTCYGNPDDQVIWVDFVATNTTMDLDVTDVTGLCPPAVAVYSGTCGALTEDFCQQFVSPVNSFNLTGLTIGQTYYVSLTYLSNPACGGYVDACFNLCGGFLPYDECVGAQSIDGTPLSSSNSCSTPGATDPPPAELCAGSIENTSWYNFTVLNTADVVITIDNITCFGGANGFQIGYFTGACGSLTNIGCNSGAGGTVTSTITGLTAGENVYIAIDGNAGADCNFDISATNTVPLPVSLSYLNGKVNILGEVVLDWATSSEQNNDYFIVQRSIDGVGFEDVGQVDGHGNSVELITYSFIDKYPYSGTSYYRLKQVDTDGKMRFSDIVSVNIDEVTDLEIYPNPVNEMARLNFSTETEDYIDIQIVDLAGRICYTDRVKTIKGNNSIELNTENLRAGSFILTVFSGSNSIQKKFMKN